MTGDHSFNLDGRGALHTAPERARWLFVLARLFAPSLDDRLGGGADPSRSVLCRVRAQELVSLPQRRAVAETWLGVLDQVRRRPPPLNGAIPFQRQSVRGAEVQVRLLAQALLRPLVTVRGTAMAVSLLRDGSGPLFNPRCNVSLAATLERVTSTIDPLSAP